MDDWTGPHWWWWLFFIVYVVGPLWLLRAMVSPEMRNQGKNADPLQASPLPGDKR